MVTIISVISKYVLILLMSIYTFECFSIFGYEEVEDKNKILRRQFLIMLLLQFIAYMVMFLQTTDIRYGILFVAQTVLIITVSILYKVTYPDASRLVLNNMCMLIGIGLIMISRLDFDKAIRQFVLVCGSLVLALVVPVIIRRVKFLMAPKMVYIYGGIGLLALAGVAVLGQTTYGARLAITIAGVSIQPSELVKIVFVFFVALRLYHATDFKSVVVTTILAALHVLVLVVSTDLGAAVILFVVYLVMLYVATKNIGYMLAGIGAGSIAAVIAYYLFSHVKVRVAVWQDPFAVYDTGGYQIAQSLFAIGTGGFSGLGLFQGSPDTIPVADEDFIFSAIAEELGMIFALGVILICVSCYIMFLNIAMQLRNRFYKLVALGLGTCYIFQVFLTIGGVTKFIPLTGVTLPFVSYGGSSLLSTAIMFAIIQGLYILREDEEDDIERKREQLQRARIKETEATERRATSKKRADTTARGDIRRGTSRGTTPKRRSVKTKKD